MLFYERKHYYNPEFKIELYKKKNKPKLLEKKDLFFYCIYQKVHDYNILDKYNENLEKIKVIECLQKIKLKHQDKIAELLTEPTMSLCCLNALCVLWKINIIWFSDYCYCEFKYDENEVIHYLYHDLQWKTNVDLSDKYKIEDVFKPLKCMSYYKLDDLKEMSQYFKVEGKKKKDYYDNILDYLKFIKLIL